MVESRLYTGLKYILTSRDVSPTIGNKDSLGTKWSGASFRQEVRAFPSHYFRYVTLPPLPLGGSLLLSVNGSYFLFGPLPFFWILGLEMIGVYLEGFWPWG
jgi:hypothetical protein